MKTTEQLRADVESAKQSVATAELALKARLSETLVRCDAGNCGKAFEVRELEYIQTQFYVPPHGCTGGDYWKDGEGRWRCPHCGFTNRLYDKPDITALKGLFKSVRVEHER